MAKKHWSIPAYDDPDTRRIRKVVAGNPKHGDAAVRFAQYRTGMTVREDIAACEALGVPNYAVYDLTWDSDPKRRLIQNSTIELTPAGGRLVVSNPSRDCTKPQRPFASSVKGLTDHAKGLVRPILAEEEGIEPPSPFQVNLRLSVWCLTNSATPGRKAHV